ncbi:MAG: cadmium-translocating P-type ATPase [Acholeplasmataceae bacterium]|nr:cadmium-translocating P-type ATPase [Acholeplasmataceae bacterium]
MNKKQLIFETSAAAIALILIIIAFFLKPAQDTLSAILFAFAFLIGGFAKAKEGVTETIKDKALNVEFLMILAALGAFVIGYYSEGAILIIIFSISGVLESYANAKSEKELLNLLALAPKTALRIDGNDVTEVPVEAMIQGDLVVVKVGMQIPVDGTIIEGETSIDAAAVTGEFVPVSKSVGDGVFAGSINIDARIVVRTDKDPKESVVQKIVDFVKEAKENAPKTQTAIDRFEKIYVYIVIALSILFMTIPPIFGWLAWKDAFYRGIIVLVVGSPCALVASVSPAMLASLSSASKQGILVKGGKHFESLRHIKAVVFDKTGTITTGHPVVHAMHFCDEIDHHQAKRVLMTIERQSDHPLAKAITAHLTGIEPIAGVQTFEKPGRGMEATINGDHWQIGRFEHPFCDDTKDGMDLSQAEGHTLVLITKNDKTVGFVALSDTIRDEATNAIKTLKSNRIEPVLLTGDHASTAQTIAHTVGIDTYESDCFPDDKVDRIKALQARLGQVMMVGDGINDAPALASADIGCAMGSATDVSLETADIVFTKNNLENINDVILLSKRYHQIIMQNIIFSTSIITFLMLSNVFGLIDLPFGVVAHETSTILVILNSLRLLSVKSDSSASR